MIPEFFEFKKLELSDREEIEIITKQFLPYSDFHFTSIFCWAFDNSTLISKLNNNLIVKQTDWTTGEQFFSIIGINSVPKTINEISTFLIKNKFPLTLRWVPEETVKYLNKINTTIVEDRDYFDYVYNVSDLFFASGSKYKKYRNGFSRFIRKHNNITTRLIDLRCETIKLQINNLLNKWVENKEFENKKCEQSFECQALNKLLSTAEEFESLIALGVFDNNELIAFIINDIIDKDYGCGLFWKANTIYKGIYQYLMKENINLYNDKKLRFFSFECDLGIESLRESKKRYHSAFFLKKYKIEFNN